MANLLFLQQILTSKNESESNIVLFNGYVHVLVFRGYIFTKQVGRFRWFKKYKNICLKNFFTQISIVSYNGMFVNNTETSKLAI